MEGRETDRETVQRDLNGVKSSAHRHNWWALFLFMVSMEQKSGKEEVQLAVVLTLEEFGGNRDENLFWNIICLNNNRRILVFSNMS